MDREFSIPKSYTVTITSGIFTINSPDRLCITGNETSLINSPNPTQDVLESLASILDIYGNQVFFEDKKIRLRSITYGTLTSEVLSFIDWNIPDGRSVFGNSAHLLKAKATGSITSIKGNVLKVPSGLFITKGVQVGDTLIISNATNNVPFNHNGEFIVEAVHTETTLSVRQKGINDKIYDTSNFPPASLNINISGGEQYGTATVIVGRYLPLNMNGTPMEFRLNNPPPDGTYKVVLPIGRTLRNLSIDDITNATIYREYGGQIELGIRLQTGNDTLKPRIMGRISSDNTHTLLGEFYTAASGSVRLYLTTTPGFIITINAKWDTITGFSKDINDVVASSLTIEGPNALFGSRLATDNAAWTTWDRVLLMPSNDFTEGTVLNSGNGIRVGSQVTSSLSKVLIPRVNYIVSNTLNTALTKASIGSLNACEYSSGSGVQRVYNATWNGTQWTRDLSNFPAIKWTYRPRTLTEEIYAASNTWVDSAWTSSNELRNYQYVDDFLKAISPVTTANAIVGDYLKTGPVHTNASVATITPGVFDPGLMGTLAVSSVGAGAFVAELYSQFSIQMGLGDFVLKFRVSTGNRSHLDTLANEGFFIGIKQYNDLLTPAFTQLCGITSGNNVTNWQLKTGNSDTPIYTALSTANVNTMTNFSIEKFGDTLRVYVNGNVAITATFNFVFLNPSIYIITRGTATGVGYASYVDTIKFWTASLL
jgi:hypothetical protein